MFVFEIPLYEAMNPAFIGLFAFIGALFGSFFNVLSQRWGSSQIAQNDEQSLFWLKLRGATTSFTPLSAKGVCSGRSACPHCQAPIPLYRNIPVLSWLLQRGRSACCQKPIALRYLAFEIAGAALFGLMGWLATPSMYGLILSITLMIGLLISVVDLQEGFIPDALLIGLGGLVLLLTLSPDHWIGSSLAVSWALGTLSVVYSLFWALSKLAGKGVLGGADQHLLVIAAALLGPTLIVSLPVMLFGLIITSAMIKTGAVKRGLFTRLLDAEKAVPAGPAIYLGMLAGSLYHLLGVSL
jgi:prepilin signal peptidase PulO-like enzyme (type II secretory pathway)